MFTSDDVQVGTVAYFDAEALNRDAAVAQPTSPTPRSGPFLCIQSENGSSTWAPISTQRRDERVLIEPAWRESGPPAWQNTDQYLNDGSTTYVGPNSSFVAAAAGKDTMVSAKRPKVTTEGVGAVLAEVSKRGGNLL